MVPLQLPHRLVTLIILGVEGTPGVCIDAKGEGLEGGFFNSC